MSLSGGGLFMKLRRFAHAFNRICPLPFLIRSVIEVAASSAMLSLTAHLVLGMGSLSRAPLPRQGGIGRVLEQARMHEGGLRSASSICLGSWRESHLAPASRCVFRLVLQLFWFRVGRHDPYPFWLISHSRGDLMRSFLRVDRPHLKLQPRLAIPH